MRLAILLLLVSSAWAGPAGRLLRLAPIRFEENRGQLAPDVRYAARGLGYSFVFRDAETALRVGGRTMALVFDGSNSKARFEGVGKSSRVNYLLGSLRAGAAAYQRLRRRGVYPGIDVVYYGNGDRLEYDLLLHPGADPDRIRVRFRGVTPRLDPAGGIVLADGLTQEPPRVYQGDGVQIACHYHMLGDGSIGVALGPYDRRQTVVVDPQIQFQTFLGGTYADGAIGVARDAQGLLYVAGYTYSTDIQLAGNAYNVIEGGNEDVFVMVLNPSAPPDSVFVYATFLGGAGNDDPRAMTIDGSGHVYVTGVTTSGDFPTTSGAFKAAAAGNTAAFVSMLDTTQNGSGSLVYSTVLAGTSGVQSGQAVAVDAAGLIYVAGYTSATDFPVAGNAVQGSANGSYDAFVAQIDPTQSGSGSLVNSTYLGGESYDVAGGIAVDSSGKVYVTGLTFSNGFPVTGSNVQNSLNGPGDAFVAELDFTTGSLVYSTYFGGSDYDEGRKIAVDKAGRIIVTGVTLSADLPVTYNGMRLSYGGNGDVFVIILDPGKPGGSAISYSTYFGGSGGEVPYDLHTDGSGNVYVGGYTQSPDLPTTSNAYQTASTGAGIDGFVAIINPAADPSKALVYSSYVTSDGTQYVSGFTFDPNGNLYITGVTTGPVFGANGAQKANTGDRDAFLLVLKP